MKRFFSLLGKAIVGVFLLPICFLATTVFMRQLTKGDPLWSSPTFHWFLGGVVLWMVWFKFGPRPTRAYVWAHEMTHVVWVWLFGGKVFDIKVGKTSGYVKTDTINIWVSLAPYFFPFYSILLVLVYGLAKHFFQIESYFLPFVGLLGMAMGFHWSFTWWALRENQPDLQEHGSFFSLTLIYLINVLILSALHIIASPEVTWSDFSNYWDEGFAKVWDWVRLEFSKDRPPPMVP